MTRAREDARHGGMGRREALRNAAVLAGAGVAYAVGGPLTGGRTMSMPQGQRGKKTYVLVHGAWHGGWCWKRLTPLLRAAGHEVHTPTLTGLGDRAHLGGTDTGLDVHIYCSDPPTGAFDQFAGAIKSNPKWTFHEMKSGHDVMITDPERLARILLSVA